MPVTGVMMSVFSSETSMLLTSASAAAASASAARTPARSESIRACRSSTVALGDTPLVSSAFSRSRVTCVSASWARAVAMRARAAVDLALAAASALR